MNVEVKKVKLTELKLNPDNPRTISKRDMDRLVKSLTEFPDMLSIREIVVDENMTVLGGNMRLQALKKAGAKDCIAKIVSGLSTAQKREFVIKDNSNFGEFDIDLLANEWSDLPLVDWGVDLPEDWLNPVEEIEQLTQKGNLADRFGIPPFSVLNAREGWWQDRKAAWIALGIKSELGRGGAVNDSGTGNNGKPKFLSEPGGSARPACDYSKRQRGDGRGRPMI